MHCWTSDNAQDTACPAPAQHTHGATPPTWQVSGAADRGRRQMGCSFRWTWRVKGILRDGTVIPGPGHLEPPFYRTTCPSSDLWPRAGTALRPGTQQESELPAAWHRPRGKQMSAAHRRSQDLALTASSARSSFLALTPLYQAHYEVRCFMI